MRSYRPADLETCTIEEGALVRRRIPCATENVRGGCGPWSRIASAMDDIPLENSVALFSLFAEFVQKNSALSKVALKNDNASITLRRSKTCSLLEASPCRCFTSLWQTSILERRMLVLLLFLHQLCRDKLFLLGCVHMMHLDWGVERSAWP